MTDDTIPYGRCPRCGHDKLRFEGWDTDTIARCTECDFFQGIEDRSTVSRSEVTADE